MKIQHLFLRNVRNIKSLDLDFRDPFTGKPMSRIVLAGANGSGKTTILESLYGLLATTGKFVTNEISPSGKLHDSEITVPLSGLTSLQVILDYGGRLGSAYYGHTEHNLVKDKSISDYEWVGGQLQEPRIRNEFVDTSIFKALSRTIQYEAERDQSGYGSIQYYPHTRYLPPVQMDKLDLVPPKNPWVYRYRPSDRWDESIEKYLFWLNYLDLEDRNKGISANRFPKAVELVNTILDDKQIVRVEKARVIVETKKGETHGLDDLSSGEKQLALLLIDISRRTYRDSMIMIDEPEISLHPAWQRGLVVALDKIIEQYDAQVIMATHSPEVASMVLPYQVMSLSDLGVPLGKWEPDKEALA